MWRMVLFLHKRIETAGCIQFLQISFLNYLAKELILYRMKKYYTTQGILYHKAPRKAIKNKDFFTFSHFFLLLLGYELTFPKKSAKMIRLEIKKRFSYDEY